MWSTRDSGRKVCLVCASVEPTVRKQELFVKGFRMAALVIYFTF